MYGEVIIAEKFFPIYKKTLKVPLFPLPKEEKHSNSSSLISIAAEERWRNRWRRQIYCGWHSLQGIFLFFFFSFKMR
jgi:hypothetical protein